MHGGNTTTTIAEKLAIEGVAHFIADEHHMREKIPCEKCMDEARRIVDLVRRVLHNKSGGEGNENDKGL